MLGRLFWFVVGFAAGVIVTVYVLIPSVRNMFGELI